MSVTRSEQASQVEGQQVPVGRAPYDIGLFPPAQICDPLLEEMVVWRDSTLPLCLQPLAIGETARRSSRRIVPAPSRIEQGRPPVEPQTRQGFGRLLMTQMLEGDLAGREAILRFCRLTFYLSAQVLALAPGA